MRKLLKQEVYNQLRKHAASIYSTQPAIRHVIISISVNEAGIDLIGPAIYVWDSLLSHVEDAGKLIDLLDFILIEYPNDEVFNRISLSVKEGTAFIEQIDYERYLKPVSEAKAVVSVIYDLQDTTIAKKLKAQLYPLVLSGCIEVKDLYTNTAGLNRQQESLKLVGESDIVLLLLTVDFFNPDNNCLQLGFSGFEMRKTVVPVLISDSLWGRIKVLKNIVPLPIEGIPVSKWKNEDEVLMQIAEGVEGIVKRLKKENQCL